MVKIGLVVPVMKNFGGFANLIKSIDTPVLPIVIPNWEENIGVSQGWNRGLERAIDANCDAVLVCNDDVVLAPGTLDTLVQESSGYDLVTAYNTRDNGQPGGPDYSCFMVKPEEFLNRFGTFDENFTPAYFEDNDMAYRIQLLGGKQGAVSAPMFHAGSVTQNMDVPVVSSPMFEQNRHYYITKWGGNPHEERYTTPFNTGGDIRLWTRIGE